ncbi:MAG: 6,7-dimethyl-8-ribityllumazine synthase [Calditrichaeota bacterium]|nr:MAG: 6,7-dimethyl-8-ribityllumazine synthase [Calditrichota bacterium]
MSKIYEGQLSAKGYRFGIVVSRFNQMISRQLLEGALDCLKRHGAAENEIEIAWVPGSFELPMVALKLAQTKRFDCIVCLGVLIRGQTPHFDYLASEAAKGIAQISQLTGVPAIFGVITADTLEQAIERAGTKGGNKGWDAALAGIEMADLFKKLSE